MDGKTFITLAQWLGRSRKYKPLNGVGGSIGIHDTRDIEQDRTWLWALSDYRVNSVTAGVIWLAPKD
jgi:hypothetical protein